MSSLILREQFNIRRMVEKELYKLWKDNPQFFTDMIVNFNDEEVDDYTVPAKL